MSVVHVIHLIHQLRYLQGGNNKRLTGKYECTNFTNNPPNANYLKGVARSVVNKKELPVCGASSNTMITPRHKPCDAVNEDILHFKKQQKLCLEKAYET